MAKTLVENKVCTACGADVRPGSVFCYNCGAAVAPESTVPAGNNNRKKTVKEALIEEELKPGNDLKTNQLDARLLGKAGETPIPKPAIREDANLQSAASLRRKSKSYQRKPVEVVWEEPDHAPNKWFPLAAIILLLFVVLIFYLAMYLK
jgi:hypothetical protein